MMILTWLILLGIFIVLAAVSEDEDYDTRGTLLTVVILSINAVWFIAPALRESFFTFYKSFDLTWLIYFGVYVLAGLIFSFYKWFRFVKWYIGKGGAGYYGEVSQEVKKLKMEQYLVLTKHYGKVTAWIAYWPFFTLRLIIGDLVLNFFKRVADMFAGIYHSIVKNQLK